MKKMKQLLAFLVSIVFNVVAADTSSWNLFRFLIQKTPGAYAHDFRLLSELVSWEELSTRYPGCVEIKKLKIRLPKEDEKDFVLSIERIRCQVHVVWKEPRFILKLQIETPTACIVTYDPFLRDTNFRRLGSKLNKELRILNKASSKSHSHSSKLLGLDGFELKGNVNLALVPCEILGGREATVTIQLDLNERDQLAKQIARAAKQSPNGYLTINETIDLIRAELSHKISAALKEAIHDASQNRNLIHLWPREWRIHATAHLGNSKLDSFQDIQNAAETVLLKRLSSWTSSLFTNLVFNNNYGSSSNKNDTN